MKIKYRPKATKQIKKFPPRVQKKILNKIELISDTPYSGKKLEGELSNFRVVRAWPYRIIYQILKNNILIFSVSHRQSAYR